MGKNLIQQRRGKGTPTYRTPSHRFKARSKYPEEVVSGVITNIIHAPGRSVPLAEVDFQGNKTHIVAAGGMHVGQMIGSVAGEGNILRLADIPEGSRIFNIELHPGDGGRLCRSAGSSALLVTRGEKKCVVRLPSKEKKTVSAKCFATMGVAASSGRKEKPLMKAGKKFYVMRSKNKLWPRTSGVAMNAVDHPFGGQTRPGKPKTVARSMPPGKKVGNIAARQTGKRKRKR